MELFAVNNTVDKPQRKPRLTTKAKEEAITAILSRVKELNFQASDEVLLLCGGFAHEIHELEGRKPRMSAKEKAIAVDQVMQWIMTGWNPTDSVMDLCTSVRIELSRKSDESGS